MAGQGPLSGRTLGGKYLLGELLGEGGFGAVYSGRHLVLERSQAIKVPLEHYFREPKFRERFLREAQTAAALDHPHIVHIDDIVMEEQETRAYLVMPFVSGGTFRDFLKQHQELLSLEQVVHYLGQICSALDYAHQHDVVHLDLKPLNLLLHEDGRLLLSDFGLAHLVKQEVLEGGTSLKHGTPHYMAPEHINGQPGKCSDIYALGVILYQMLMGRCPFEGTMEMVMYKHLNEQPPPLRASRPELPQELEEVLERVLAKQGEKRYQSSGELLMAFKGALVLAQDRVREAEEQTRRAEEERVRRAEVEQEQARRAEVEQAHRAEVERVRQNAEERVRRAEERASKAEEELARKSQEDQAYRAEIQRAYRDDIGWIRQGVEGRIHNAEERVRHQAEEELARKAEEERLRRAEVEQAHRAEVERVRQNAEERVRRAEERASKAEQERDRDPYTDMIIRPPSIRPLNPLYDEESDLFEEDYNTLLRTREAAQKDTATQIHHTQTTNHPTDDPYPPDPDLDIPDDFYPASGTLNSLAKTTPKPLENKSKPANTPKPITRKFIKPVDYDAEIDDNLLYSKAPPSSVRRYLSLPEHDTLNDPTEGPFLKRGRQSTINRQQTNEDKKEPNGTSTNKQSIIEGILVFFALIAGALLALSGLLGLLIAPVMGKFYFNLDPLHNLADLVIGLIGCILFAFTRVTDNNKLINIFMTGILIYNCILSITCLTIGIAGLLYPPFYSHYILIALTRAGTINSIIYLAVGIPFGIPAGILGFFLLGVLTVNIFIRVRSKWIRYRLSRQKV